MVPGTSPLPQPQTPATRLIKLAAVGFGALIVSAIAAANIGFKHPGYFFVRTLPFGDKVGHLVLFGGLALVVNLALRCRSVRLAGVAVPIGTAAVTVFVVVEELSQGFLSNRSLDGTDLAADLVGIALATIAAPRLDRLLHAH